MATLGWSVKSGALFTNTPSFTTLLDAVERAERRLHLREQHDPATPCGRDAAFQIHVLAKPAEDQAAVLGEADLAGDVEQAALLDRRDIGGDGGGGLRKVDAEFGEALVNAHGRRLNTR